ncbi:MAG: hypothetical protein Q7K40_05645 [bacterium]|nr:hypothetical protein [bacterium]
MNIISKNRGFIQIVLLAIVIIAALVYFNVDVRGFFENPGIQKFIAILKGAWTNFIVPLFSYLWTSIAGLFN